MKGWIVILLALVVSPFTKGAETIADTSAPTDHIVEMTRPVKASYTLSGGASTLADTYLSPLRYTGAAISMDYERRQAMKFNPELWTMRLSGRLEGMRATGPGGGSTLWEAALRLNWDMTHRWRPTESLTLAAGGGAGLMLGCIYNDASSNNPVSAKASFTLDFSGFAAWRTKIGRLPLTVCWQPTVPVTGLFFSPDYGEPYYEIYLGNHSGLVHPAWWGNYRAFDSLLTADLHFGATALRIGFRSGFLSTKVDYITSRIVSNCLVIGVSGEWMSVDRRRQLSPATKIISALY